MLEEHQNGNWVYYPISSSGIDVKYTLQNINGQTCVIYKYRISKKYFETKSVQNLVNKSDNSVYISFATQNDGRTVMYTAAQFYENIFGSANSSLQNIIKKINYKNKMDQLEKLTKEKYDLWQAQQATYERDYASGTVNPNQLEANRKAAETSKNLYEKYKVTYDAVTQEYNNIDADYPIEGIIFAPYTKGIDYGLSTSKGWSAANDYDNKLYLPEANKKAVYVNYVEKDDKGNLKEITGVTPKSTITESDVFNYIHGYTTNNKVSWISLLNPTPENVEMSTDKDKKYEQYKFSELSNSNYAKFIMMSEEELKDKTGKEYIYSNIVTYQGNSSDTYDTLWAQVKGGSGSNHSNKGINVPISKNDPVIVTFVYTPKKQKTVYVNYVQENTDKSLTVLLAPKYEIDSDEDQGIHEYTVDSNWFSLLDFVENSSNKVDQYEQYVFNDFKKYPNLKARFIKMSEDELNGRLGAAEGEEYKYKTIKYVKGNKGDDYSTLMLKNQESGTYFKNRAISTTISNEKPLLISFIYKPPVVEKLNIEVVHKSENTAVLLPLAQNGHNMSEYLEKKVSNDNKHAYYVIDAGETKNTTATIRQTEYTDEDKVMTYNNKIRVEYYYNDRLKSYKVLNSVTQVTLNIENTLNDGCNNVKIIFYYQSNASYQESSIIICPTLSFQTSFGSSGTIDCENGKKGQTNSKSCYSGVAPEDVKTNTSLLMVPTDKEIRGALSTSGYILNNITQLVTIGSHKDKILLAGETAQVEFIDKMAGHEIYGYRSIPYTEKDDEGKEVTKYKTEKYFTGSYFQHPNQVGVSNDKIDPREVRNRILKNQKAIANGTQYLQGIPAVIDEGESVECQTITCGGCGHQVTIYKKKYRTFNVYTATIVASTYNGVYLSKATLENYDSSTTNPDAYYAYPDETRLIGGNSYNVIENNDNYYYFQVEDTSDILRNAVKINYTTINNPLACYGRWKQEEVEYYDSTEGKKKTYTKWSCEEDGSGYGTGAGYLSVLATNNLDMRAKINNNGGTYYTDYFTITNNRYNGERLATSILEYTNLGNKLSENYASLYDANTTTLLGSGDRQESRVYANMQEAIQKTADSLRQNAVYGLNLDDCGEGNGGSNAGTGTTTNNVSEEFSATVISKYYSQTSGVNVVNSATLDSTLSIRTPQNMVSQTLGDKKAFTLQLGVETEATPKLAVSDAVYGTKLSVAERKQYIKYYIYSFNFPVKYNGVDYPENTPILVDVSNKVEAEDQQEDYIDTRATIKFTPTGTNSARGLARGENYVSSKVNIRHDEIHVVAVTKNVPSYNDAIELYRSAIQKYITGDMTYFGINDTKVCTYPTDVTKNTASSILVGLGKKIRDDAYYLSNVASVVTNNISRVYDFEVTDCTDVNFKNVFRKNTNGVSEHTGTVYFSGLKRLNVFNNTYTDSNNKSTILPIGPYKQQGGYVDAPKIGYRISFDLKTSGYYDFNNTNQKRTVVILPKLYYISKDGTKFIQNVEAYYKNSNNKYIKMPQATIYDDENYYIKCANGSLVGGYTIDYTPNDGYRNVLSIGITEVADMFTKEKRTLDMSSIVLTKEMMCTNNDGFIQTWYGEYKLPNSTILVENKNGKVDLNSPLTDGYLGVVFYIGVVEQSTGDSSIVISYNVPDQNAASKTNSTQWDYEQYIGFANAGNVVNGTLKLQLAKGIWYIDNAIYQKVKGTVVLYDLDNRAASDFE